MAWDATIVTTLTDSYIEASSTCAGSASESASVRKWAKYSSLPSEYLFQPIALESLGTASTDTATFLSDLGRLISGVSGDPREGFYLWQRVSVCLQRFNSVFLRQSFEELGEEPDG